MSLLQGMMFFGEAAFVHREEAFLTLSSNRLLVLKNIMHCSSYEIL